MVAISHFQANQAGSSNAMELFGAKRCFEFLKNAGLKIPSFISDRHRSIAKWIRESEPETKHFHDFWHVSKSITKRLLAASQEKGNEILKSWMKGIRNHLYWCAVSTKQGFGELIIAKWKSIMHHVADQHSDHPDPLFQNCAHEEIEPRDWIPKGLSL